jgi:hypothetical protein
VILFDRPGVPGDDFSGWITSNEIDVERVVLSDGEKPPSDKTEMLRGGSYSVTKDEIAKIRTAREGLS